MARHFPKLLFALVCINLAFFGYAWWIDCVPVASRPALASVEHLAEALDIRPDEQKFLEIAWVPTLGEALDLGREMRKPIMVICSNGSICNGRL